MLSRARKPHTSWRRQHGVAAAAGAATAAVAAAAAAAAGVPAAVTTFFPPAVWAQWSVVATAAYLLYWAGLAKSMPMGMPVANWQSKTAEQRQLLMVVVLAVLLVTFVLPILAMLSSGAWAAGLTYFLPIMVQTVLNVAVESRSRQSGRVLAVYGSTTINNMWRTGASLAALWDMSLVTGGAHPALQLTSALQVVVYVAVVLIIVPAAIAQLPIQAEQ